MTPPLSLTIGIQLDQPLPDTQPSPAHQTGKHLAGYLANTSTAHLIGTSEDPDHRRITWTVAVDPGDDPALGPRLDALEHFAGAAVAWAGETYLGNDELGYRVVELHGLTMDEVDRRLARPSTPDVVGLDDFLELLGIDGKPISRQRLHQLRETDPAFPKAVARGVWLRTPAERYAAARNTRTGRPPKTS